jgi:hypothetical protein
MGTPAVDQPFASATSSTSFPRLNDIDLRRAQSWDNSRREDDGDIRKNRYMIFHSSANFRCRNEPQVKLRRAESDEYYPTRCLS